MSDNTRIDQYSRTQIRAAALDRMLHVFSDLSHPDKVFAEVLDIVEEAVPCEAASLLIVTGEDGEMTFVAATGPVAEKIKGMKLKPGIGIAGACARDHLPIPVSDVQKEPRFAKEVSEALGFTTRSLLAIPILFRGDLAGVIELVNKKETDEWTRGEIELIERIARATGSILNLIGERSK
jgi:GAF domain-containing protein